MSRTTIIPLIPGEIDIVTSKGEYNFQEVLDDFPNAGSIFVTTYNISAHRNKLIRALEEATEHADVRIITNIPTRHDQYFGNAPRERASQSIERYTQRLDPSKIENLATSFNFSNHSKVIMTENIAYIGSANFSDESDQSRETGFLVRSQDLVKVISENLLPILINEGIPYFGSMLDDKKILLSFLLSKLEGVASSIRDGLFTFVGHPLEDQEVYNIHDPYLRKSDLEGLLEVLDEIEGELDNEFREVAGLEHVVDLIDIDSINAISALCDYDTPIHELAEFDSVEYASDLLSEQMVHNEDMNDASQDAVDSAAEKHYDLAVAAEGPVKELYEYLEQVKNSFQVAVNEIMRLEVQQATIDNT
ncbi:phospholipase D-like domain-containing protein [Paenibacillus tyrfis]|uniref:phospholipase D-like domain-containing protein n=1 Tax=Paenibacillus tyrfis TaxID=1501230 RepID=UPI00209EEB82|nr:phospholipase D-like domain-containing protein [Paenibacillus tyrfis]MCP1312492.1 phospholipase D-like domain-containing protein [Paenibacillus tyrfis]